MAASQLIVQLLRRFAADCYFCFRKMGLKSFAERQKNNQQSETISRDNGVTISEANQLQGSETIKQSATKWRYNQ